MAKGRNLKKASLMLLIMLPVIYIGFGWYLGLSHGCKSVIFGPYSDIPVAVKTSLLGSSLEDISGQKAIMMVVPLKDAIAGDTEDTAYFKRAGYFEIPGSWKFNFRPYKDNHNFKKTFILTGSYSHAICHDIKNPGCNIGSLSVEELNVFLARSGRYRDAQKLKPYLFISRLEAKYPWAYSETVLVSRAMGNILKDNTLPYDVLGLFVIVVLFIALVSGVFIYGCTTYIG